MREHFPGLISPYKVVDFEEAFRNVVRYPGSCLPQKVLYAAPAASQAYIRACETGIIGSVYRDFPLGRRNHKMTTFFDENVVRKLEQLGESEGSGIGIFVLGTGACNRELTIVNWLSDNLPNVKFKVFLIDISMDLIRESCVTFRHSRSNVVYAYLQEDFERRPETIQTIRRREFGQNPCVFLHLGNTFGNIDQSAFLGQLAIMMEHQDVFVSEFLTFDSANSQYEEYSANSEYWDEGYNAISDPRSDFLTQTLVSIGINAKRENVRKRRIADLFGVTDVFHYFFSPDQKRAFRERIFGNDGQGYCPDSIAMLKISSLNLDSAETILTRFFSNAGIETIEYNAEGNPINMTYAICSGVRIKAGDSQSERIEFAETYDSRYTINLNNRIVGYRTEKISLSWAELAFFMCLIKNAGTSTNAISLLENFIAYLDKFCDIFDTACRDARTQQVLSRAKTQYENDASGTDKNVLSHIKSALRKKLKSKHFLSKLEQDMPSHSLQTGFSTLTSADFLIEPADFEI